MDHDGGPSRLSNQVAAKPRHGPRPGRGMRDDLGPAGSIGRRRRPGRAPGVDEEMLGIGVGVEAGQVSGQAGWAAVLVGAARLVQEEG